MSDLSDLLSGPDPDFDADPTPPGDVDTVNAWLYRLSRLDAEQAEDQALAAAQIERIGAWLEERTLTRQPRRAWLARALADYHRAVLRDNPRQATVSLPCGDLVSRRGTEYEVTDEAALIAWAQENAPELAPAPPAPEPKLSRQALRKLPTTLPSKPTEGDHGLAVAPSGEPVPGVVVTATRSFTVKPKP